MKNPWLSAWLSGANAWSGAARSIMTAEIRRGQRKAMRDMLKPAVALKKPKRRTAKRKPSVS
jgi:hypothetical protein